ncbi:MAG: disulfide bond formation protein DsbB [Parcubacteria group bacterium Gr01-1014_8]|nr:MAG: disulfide bond formation protein DsbB [Parcubacteria group bacterium Gr01-1014_8]
MSVGDLNSLLALGTLAIQIASAVLLAVYFLPNLIPGAYEIRAYVGKWGIALGLVLILTTAAANLYYESFGFEPCYWCYWQRIFLYPQAVLFGVALWKRDMQIADHSIALSIFGAGVALYHHALQMLPGSGLPCPSVGVSCATRILFEFGYITYPLMAFSLFAFLIVLMLFVRSSYQAK